MASYTENPAGESRKARLERHKAQTRELLAPAEAVRTEEWNKTTGAWLNAELVMGAGVVSPPGQVRFKRAYAGMRAGRGTWAMVSSRDAKMPAETLRNIGTYGWAASPFGDDDTAALKLAAEQGTSTVLVHSADGTLSIRPVSEYRKLKRERQAKREAVVSAAERQAASDAAAMARMGTIHDDAA